jgi:diacylglycerol kinase family enzyme
VRLLLIVNPVASSVTRRARVVIQKALASDHELDVTETSRRGQAIRLARQAARSGTDLVIALGGDGTINEVANGVIGQQCRIAPLPAGSTNVFARSIGYPNDPVEATGVLLEALAGGNEIEASVGMANGRAFLFHAGAGFDAAVVDRVERRGQLKRYMGHPYFVLSTLATWFGQVGDRTRFAIETDTGESLTDAKLAIAMNTTPYTYLGHTPLHFAPEASLQAPLSVVVLTSLSPRVVPTLVAAVRRDSGLSQRAGAHHWSGVCWARITSHAPVPYQLDGESMEPVKELVLEHRPAALRLVAPSPDET